LQRLLADKAAALNPEFGFDAFALTAEWAEDLGAAQDSLIEEPSGERELARLVDRLTVKLGPRRVRRPQPQQGHVPERASGMVAARVVGAAARLLSGRGRGRPPILDLPRRADRRWTRRASRLVHPRAFRLMLALICHCEEPKATRQSRKAGLLPPDQVRGRNDERRRSADA